MSATLIVLSKPAIPGQVKTRLTPKLSPHAAARIHSAMRQCLLNRLVRHCHPHPSSFILAQNNHDQDHCLTLPHPFQQIPQSQGDLGERMCRIWQQYPSQPIIFLGTDSPDLPKEILTMITKEVKEKDAIVGPVSDGGYYTLGVREYRPALLTNISWGSTKVLAQTQMRAKSQKIDLLNLPSWYDIDTYPDLLALIARIKNSKEHDLQVLYQELTTIVKE